MYVYGDITEYMWLSMVIYVLSEFIQLHVDQYENQNLTFIRQTLFSDSQKLTPLSS